MMVRLNVMMKIQFSIAIIDLIPRHSSCSKVVPTWQRNCLPPVGCGKSERREHNMSHNCSKFNVACTCFLAGVDVLDTISCTYIIFPLVEGFVMYRSVTLYTEYTSHYQDIHFYSILQMPSI